MKEWGLTPMEWLAQPKEHRALMLAMVDTEGRMQAVEETERRQREFLRTGKC